MNRDGAERGMDDETKTKSWTLLPWNRWQAKETRKKNLHREEKKQKKEFFGKYPILNQSGM